MIIVDGWVIFVSINYCLQCIVCVFVNVILFYDCENQKIKLKINKNNFYFVKNCHEYLLNGYENIR